MKKSALILLVTSLTAYSLGFSATLNSIDKDQVKQAFVNKTFTSAGTARLTGQTMGVIFTGSTDDHGNIRGKFSQAPSQDPQSDQGTYTIKDDGQLCITWQHWHDAKEFCDYIYDTENAYVIVDVNNKFHINFLKSDIRAN